MHTLRRGQSARADPVDGEAGNGVREAREQPDVAAEREALVADLRSHTEVQLVTAPPEARRVSSPADLRLLEALSR